MANVLSTKIKKAIAKWNEHRLQDDREPTAQVIIHAEPQIHLLTRSADLEKDFDIGLESLCRQLEAKSDLLEEADAVTFARKESGQEWTFLYATTKAGNVIASKACHEATLERVEEIRRTRRICICLRHTITGEERHYETTALFSPTDDPHRYTIRFNSYPELTDEWECYAYSLLTRESDNHQ